MLDSEHSLELEQESARLASGCMQIGRGDLGSALKYEIQRLASESSTDQEAGRKHELACLRMASDCMELAGTVQSAGLQRHFLELARHLTAAAEPTATSTMTTSI